LSRLRLHSLELRRLLTDLVWCYKILFGIVVMSAAEEFFVLSTCSQTGGHRYKLFKKHNATRLRAAFFSEHIINTWNYLLRQESVVDFSSLPRFRRSIQKVDFSIFFGVFSVVF